MEWPVATYTVRKFTPAITKREANGCRLQLPGVVDQKASSTVFLPVLQVNVPGSLTRDTIHSDNVTMPLADWR
jgi:hypothetical protein